MSTHIVTIDNYAGQGYLPDIEPAHFDNLTDAAEYLHEEISYTVGIFRPGWDDHDIPPVDFIRRSVQIDRQYVYRIGNIHHYIAEVL